MTLRHLIIFIRVADLGSMTAAAKSLYISQPTVSQAVSELEEYYGIKLFDRLSRHLYITDSGSQLLGYARHITGLFNEMEQAMKNPDKAGRLKIGASMTVGTCLLPKLISRFTKKCPSVQVQAVVKNTKDMEQLILQNDVDFAVVEGIVHDPDITVIPFFEDELVLVCGRNHPLYQAKKIPLPDLRRLEYIVREQGSGTRELFEIKMAAEELEWQPIWECNDSNGLISAAVSGIGVAVISQLLVRNEIQSGELSTLHVEGFDLKRKFCVIYHKNKYLTNSMKTFFELCTNEVYHQLL